MDSSSWSKTNLIFVCTNFGSNKDGIGHYCSKIVGELQNYQEFTVSVLSNRTEEMGKWRLFFTFGTFVNLLKIAFQRCDSSFNQVVILEYPFVDYNPFNLVALIILRMVKRNSMKLVISLHEYARTKTFRRLFIQLIVPLCDEVFYTVEEDVTRFRKLKIPFIQREIPSNIESEKPVNLNLKIGGNFCFFGIINRQTKEIDKMIEGWSRFVKSNNRELSFHFITSSDDKEIRANEDIIFHHSLADKDVSNLLTKMDFIVLPLYPKISINNASLTAGCLHGCIPIGIFDSEKFNSNFGIQMEEYSMEKFALAFQKTQELKLEDIRTLRNQVIAYGKHKSVKKSVIPYLELAKKEVA